MTTLTIELPDNLAKEAKDAGLLAADAMENLLREAMRARRIDRLFETMSRLRSQTPALSEEEVQAEIQAARAARRTANADRR